MSIKGNKLKHKNRFDYMNLSYIPKLKQMDCQKY